MSLYQHILLIDDDEDDQEIFLAAMDNIPTKINCTVLSSASDALAKLGQYELKPDLIFLDLNMPKMTGQQFLAEIKKHDKLQEIPVIVLSTASHAATIAETKRLGAINFITKPSGFTDLISILKEVISGS